MRRNLGVCVYVVSILRAVSKTKEKGTPTGGMGHGAYPRCKKRGPEQWNSVSFKCGSRISVLEQGEGEGEERGGGKAMPKVKERKRG